ncbi:hypothetical protein HPP92_011748 [Vanilla planifolia]|uniref:Peptidase A1 domain-containing protein n=1 Tax=Vanilla planifolia TaxID=51239 RepID=A0A835R3D5_VANPL|nr:hypothetical protein HPP92_011748 [Vanilla planifolia]
MVRPHPLLFLLLAAALLPVFRRASAGSRCDAPRDRGSTLSLLPVFSPCSTVQPSPNPSSFLDTLNALSSRDASRFSFLTSAVGNRRHSVPVASGRSIFQSSTYVARASLGTPSQPLLVSIDISSDASWFPSSAFSPTNSSTFVALPCTSPLCSQVLATPISSCTSCAFNLTYASSSLSATLSQDSLSLATDSINSFTFATVATSPASPNPNSIPSAGPPRPRLRITLLLSQTKPLYASTFSYCFPPSAPQNFSGASGSDP